MNIRGLFILSTIILLGACSKSRNFVPPDVVEALQAKDVKNLKPDRILTEAESRSVEIENWFTKDPELDKAEGVSAEKAYRDLNLSNQKEIVVAVIDSGVDIQHEDLQGKIWVNKNEIPDNKIDDDKNGYVDDVYGWNFIGGHDKDGNNVSLEDEQLEVTRELVRMKAKQAALEKEGLELSKEEAVYLKKVGDEVKAARAQGEKVTQYVDLLLSRLKVDYEVLKGLLKVEFQDLKKNDVTAVLPRTEEQEAAKKDALEIFNNAGLSSVVQFNAAKAQYDTVLNVYYNEDFNPRLIVGDDPNNMNDIHYGNNDVRGLGAEHGTHVAGIIAANRDNGFGIKGVAQNVKIMSLRVVPNGDERDKDIALAVRYAADNGAKVINMSFGKPYSPRKDVVGAAFKYAESKGVLMVHAAGNESTNKDLIENYPTRAVYNKEGNKVGVVNSWLDVGASSQFRNRYLTASFSNFGHSTVDLFSPGVNLRSTIPDNRYAVYSGTSMASPAAAGVAALVWSQEPRLSVQELKSKLMSSARSRAGLMVQLPGDSSQDVPFETLSVTGGIIDAYAAIQSVLN